MPIKIPATKDAILETMTKDELVWWIRYKSFMRQPTCSDVLSYRWDMAVRKNQAEMDRYLEEGKKIVELAKRYDEIFRLIKSEKNHNVIADLLGEAGSLRIKIKSHHDKWPKLMANEKRAEAMLDAYKKAYKEERACP